jgi:hypothetical protein
MGVGDSRRRRMEELRGLDGRRRLRGGHGHVVWDDTWLVGDVVPLGADDLT